MAVAVTAAPQDAPAELIERCIQFYRDSGSFDSANAMADAVTALAGRFNEDEVGRVLAAAANSQVLYSFRFPQVVEALGASRAVSSERFDALLVQYQISVKYPNLLGCAQPPAASGAA